MQHHALQEIHHLAAFVAKFPKLFDEVKSRPGFEEIERRIVASIGNTDTVSDGLRAYEAAQSLIPNWKFVFASASGPLPGLSINRNFSDGSAVRSLFPTERVLVLDKETHSSMLAHRDAIFPIDYSIALDTQALSYLAPFLEGATKGLPDDFREVFEFIARDDVNVDPLPYMLENIPNAKDECNHFEIRRRLEAYEILRTIDAQQLQESGEVRSTLTPEERRENVKARFAEMLEIGSDSKKLAASMRDQTLSYCALLKMASIQLRKPSSSAYQSKISEFVEFMDKELKTMLAREAIIAASLFERGQSKFKFFGKIQKKNDHNLKELRAMAWDFAHIRHIESVATRIEWSHRDDGQQARYFFPALLTCDKRYIEVLDLYPLKCYAYKDGMSRPMPFPAVDWLQAIAGDESAQNSFIGEYYSNEAVKRRDLERHVGGLEELKAKLEIELLSAAS
ncbi:hypothetical protein [Pseudoduganella violacea]|uniref:Uncharacterized protein n=1 Tax=Pseudoduganella violacea TaxID=1715466 RepID=A0A7W5BFX3_9BURK|nr:hypothetical protein [Pseudoduganella violacea]MBB3122457.1 hypothetical protein [Pseudoduganella violacea]